MVWLTCALLVLLMGIYVLTPLFRMPKTAREIELATETELDRLLDRKTVVYGNLRDLEFEYKMGRLSESDFQQLGAAYRNEAAAILQRLDDLGASENLNETGKPASESTAANVSPVCPSCGAEILAGKKYCADCGHKL